jgi:hypothetical protein
MEGSAGKQALGRGRQGAAHLWEVGTDARTPSAAGILVGSVLYEQME